ncbi:Ankyrin repeats (3 copies) [Legionella quinlivanii]|uniref:Ankyrin repeats (3 copies) n=1 Tax=Legionella quinlivanii TaxID=45073 RepID=A0A0W0Y6L8_9GAMM|nr:ankyrin repeat domain-containing protein [Legionella quinlivanii]KTD52619.1 Ankyrin repeats (3 copies) [Legionella quinlivanii]SEG26270.1 Ankyrin repeat [Legionella quinlivanii DSM 21216]STY10299.1 Ribulose-5-phosphate 4-epimerase and related epimerases and aldolases [Legionella quinlivanii]
MFTSETQGLYKQDNPELVKLLVAQKQDLDKEEWNPVSRPQSIPSGTLLYIACMENRVAIVEALLKAGANPDLSISLEQMSPLLIACKMGHEQVVRLLIKYGANVQQANQMGETPLYLACASNHQRIIERLLIAKANPQQTNSKGETALFIACSEGLPLAVKNLIGAGADIEHTSEEGKTILHALFNRIEKERVNQSRYAKYLKVLKLLFDLGVDIDKPLVGLVTPFIQSLERNARDQNKMIIDQIVSSRIYASPTDIRRQFNDTYMEQLSISREITDGLPAALAFSFRFTPQRIKLLLKRGASLENDTQWNQLLLACIEENIAKVRAMLTETVKRDEKDIQCMPMDLACFTGNIELVRLLETNQLTRECSEGYTPLMRACQYGHSDLAKERLKQDEINHEAAKVSALSLACSYGHKHVIEILMDHPEIEVKINSIYAAAYANNVTLVNELYESPACKALPDPERMLWVSCHSNHNEIILNHLDKYPALINQIDKKDRTALYHACANNNLLLVMALLKRGAQLPASNNLNSEETRPNPLLIASIKGHFAILKAMVEHYKPDNKLLQECLLKACAYGHLGIVQFLLTKGASPIHQGDSWITPLHEATRNGHVDVVRELLVLGASPFTKNSMGRSPNDIAHSHNNESLVTMFSLVATFGSSIYTGKKLNMTYGSNNNLVFWQSALYSPIAESMDVNKISAASSLNQA